MRAQTLIQAMLEAADQGGVRERGLELIDRAVIEGCLFLELTESPSLPR